MCYCILYVLLHIVCVIAFLSNFTTVSQQVCWQQLHVKSHDEFKLVTILLFAHFVVAISCGFWRITIKIINFAGTGFLNFQAQHFQNSDPNAFIIIEITFSRKKRFLQYPYFCYLTHHCWGDVWHSGVRTGWSALQEFWNFKRKLLKLKFRKNSKRTPPV